jgi:hypothetical protein
MPAANTLGFIGWVLNGSNDSFPKTPKGRAMPCLRCVNASDISLLIRDVTVNSHLRALFRICDFSPSELGSDGQNNDSRAIGTSVSMMANSKRR